MIIKNHELKNQTVLTLLFEFFYWAGTLEIDTKETDLYMRVEG